MDLSCRESKKSNFNLNNITFELNLQDIINQINEKHLNYTENGVEIEKFNNTNYPNLDTTTQNFFGSISRDNNTYYGGLNMRLERNNYGLNKGAEGDVYIGNYLRDFRMGPGIYINHPIKEGSLYKKTIQYELYNGGWNKNKKNGLGTYYFITEPVNNNNFSDATMQVYIGEFLNDVFQRGLFLQKNNGKFNCYYGSFKDGNMHDSKALIYYNENDQVLRVRYENGIISHAYITTFSFEDKDNETTDISFISYSNVDGVNTPKGTTSEAFIDQETVVKLKEEATEFRKILYSEDWFTKAYENSKNILNKKDYIINQNGTGFNSNEGYKKVAELLKIVSEQDAFKKLFKKLG